MKRYLMLLLMCAAITGVQILFADQENESERTAFNAGYSMVLNKQWQTAVEHLQTFINNHPESRYTDDAAYWKAYALKHIDKEKSAEAYRSFIEQYPGSRYIDDVVADLGTLERNRIAQPTNIDREVLRTKSQMLQLEGQLLRSQSRLLQAEGALLSVNRLSPQFIDSPPLTVTPLFARRSPVGDEKPDEELQLRLESINALVRISPDDETLDFLRRIITDRNEHREVRIEAMYSMRHFDKFPDKELLLTLIEDEIDEGLRLYAIQEIGKNTETHSMQSFQLLSEIALDKDENKRVRATAIQALSQFENHETSDIFEKFIRGDYDMNIRLYALQSFIRTIEKKPGDYLPLFKSLILDANQDKQLRFAVLRYLSRIDHPVVADVFIDLFTLEEDEEFKVAIIHQLPALKQIDKKHYAEFIQDLSLNTDQPKQIRIASLNALQRLDDDTRINTLLRIAKHDRDKEMRHFAIIALTRIDKALSFQTMTDLMEIPEMQDPATFGVLLHSIASIGAGESVDILAHVARTHENYEIRRYAIRMLGNIGGEKARGVLYEILTQ